MRLRPGIAAALTLSVTLGALVGPVLGSSGASSLAAAAAADVPAAPDAGTPDAETRQILQDDDSASLDKNGFLFYVDPATDPPADYQPSPQGTQGRIAGRSPGFTTSQAGLAIPALSSRPSSTHTVYLDFNGIDLPATSAWSNAQQPGDAVIAAGTYSGFTLDGSADFSQAEIDFIQKTWRIVAEKYSPFDVNVTTVDPGLAGLARTTTNDSTYGVQVVITDDPSPVSQICSNQCAGIAYNDLFDGWYQGTQYNTTNYTVAWVFSSKTFGSAQMTALDAAHEIGHTLGLNHDGGSANPNYYAGHANWIPIMGLTNQQAVSQFSKGEYTGATNTQDDLADIALNGNSHSVGSLLVADDFGSGTSPTALGDQTSYTIDGVISGAGDDDLFSISRTCTDPMTASATGIGSGQSLDIALEILNSTGSSVLASNNPASGQTTQSGDIGNVPTGVDATATLASTTAGATYRIRVDGSGAGANPSVGYSDYGSIGQYHLTISGCANTTTVPGPPASASATGAFRAPTAQLDWTAPTSDGGSAITGYQITGLPGGPVTLGNVLTYNATGLTPGTTYPVVIKAINAIGTSATGAGVNVKVDTWAPTTKPGLTASLSGSTATVTWTAPANPGNATLTGWRVIATGASPVDETLAAGTLTKNYPVAVGTTTYTVTGVYTATDLTGVTASDPQSVVRSADPTTPSAPTSPAAAQIPRSSTGTISWSAPVTNGGSTVTGYRVTGLPGGAVVLGKVLSYTAEDLTPGTTYNLGIQAQNGVGLGPSATTSLVIGTWAPTSKPVVTVTRSGTAATVSWTIPANPGGATLTGWQVQRNGPGALPADQEVSAAVLNSTTTFTGLASGTHAFTVRGEYTASDTGGVASSEAATIVVPSRPSAPRIRAASSGARGGAKTATVRWAPPLRTGGAAITSYKIVAYKMVRGKVARRYVSSVRPRSARRYVWRLPGGLYKFRVVAYNSAGSSPGSAYSKVVRSR